MKKSVIIVMTVALAVLATSCKPERKELAGTWRWVATSGGIGGEEPFYSWFSLHIPETQCKMIAETTNGIITLAPSNIATLGHSEVDGQVLSICDNFYDGFAITFVKKQ